MKSTPIHTFRNKLINSMFLQHFKGIEKKYIY